MPNQLAAHRQRLSLAEHRAVVAAATRVSRLRKTTLTDLLSQAIRREVRAAVDDPACVGAVRKAVLQLAPELPEGPVTAAQLRRFKREQREFDQVVLDLGLLTPRQLQARNSVNQSAPVRPLNFLHAHAALAR